MNIFEDAKLFPYFEGDSLVGTEMTLKMTQVHFDELPNHKWELERKMTLGFSGTDKRLVLNKTNAKRIALIHGPETDQWNGKSITLISERVQAFGKMHNAIRIKLTDKQAENVFEQPSEVDPVTEVPDVANDEWQPTVTDFYARIKADFAIEGEPVDTNTANSIFKNECGKTGLERETRNGRTYVTNASELYNCLAEVFREKSDFPMPEKDAIPLRNAAVNAIQNVKE